MSGDEAFALTEPFPRGSYRSWAGLDSLVAETLMTRWVFD